MKIMMKLFSLVICLSILSFSNVYAFEVQSSDQAALPQDNSGLRSVRGDFVSLSSDRVLKTSVGEYSLSSVSIVDDQRSDKNDSSHVVITLQGDTVKNVTIYQ